LRFTKENCQYCRYYRVHENTSECLLIGRTLSIVKGADAYADTWRVCDGYKLRPKKWNIDVKKNPHFLDPHVPRKTLLNIRNKMFRMGVNKCTKT
jgi:hypothetical protein